MAAGLSAHILCNSIPAPSDDRKQFFHYQYSFSTLPLCYYDVTKSLKQWGNAVRLSNALNEI